MKKYALLLVIILVGGCYKPPVVKVGDVYAFSNPGIQNPFEPPEPFTAIFTITEIKDGWAKVKIVYAEPNGKSFSAELCKSIYSIQKYNTKLSP